MASRRPPSTADLFAGQRVRPTEPFDECSSRRTKVAPSSRQGSHLTDTSWQKVFSPRRFLAGSPFFQAIFGKKSFFPGDSWRDVRFPGRFLATVHEEPAKAAGPLPVPSAERMLVVACKKPKQGAVACDITTALRRMPPSSVILPQAARILHSTGHGVRGTSPLSVGCGGRRVGNGPPNSSAWNPRFVSRVGRATDHSHDSCGERLPNPLLVLGIPENPTSSCETSEPNQN
jgi:hypothetical protein